MKKIVILFMFFVMCFSVVYGFFYSIPVCYAEENEILTESYYIVDEEENYISERSNVKVGDIIITKDFLMYEVYLVDEVDLYAKARLTKQLEKPLVTRKQVEKISSNVSKKIGLYMTHNDESYLIGDGYDSVYGVGGIHDVAKKLNDSLKNMGIITLFDETLHIPHNSSAYSRSVVTAKKLLSGGDLDAIFDIHRDGVSRVNYATTYGGKERSKVKIVVGQANPNKEQNLQFALYLMSVAETLYPWLFSDIYYASGNYNQNLSSKSLLFEMGTYTIEKDLVLETVPYLADVINTTLYKTSVDENTGELTIGSVSAGNSVNDILESGESKNTSLFWLILFCVIGIMIIVWFVLSMISKVKNDKNNKKV